MVGKGFLFWRLVNNQKKLAPIETLQKLMAMGETSGIRRAKIDAVLINSRAIVRIIIVGLLIIENINKKNYFHCISFFLILINCGHIFVWIILFVRNKTTPLYNCYTYRVGIFIPNALASYHQGFYVNRWSSQSKYLCC